MLHRLNNLTGCTSIYQNEHESESLLQVVPHLSFDNMVSESVKPATGIALYFYYIYARIHTYLQYETVHRAEP